MKRFFTTAIFLGAMLSLPVHGLLAIEPTGSVASGPAAPSPEQAAQPAAVNSLSNTQHLLQAGSSLPTTESLVPRMVGGLVMVFSMLGFLAAWSKKFSKNRKGTNSENNITVLSRQSLTPKHTLFLVETMGKTILVGTAGETMQVVTDIGKSNSAIGEKDFTSVLDREFEIDSFHLAESTLREPAFCKNSKPGW